MAVRDSFGVEGASGDIPAPSGGGGCGSGPGGRTRRGGTAHPVAAGKRAGSWRASLQACKLRVRSGVGVGLVWRPQPQVAVARSGGVVRINLASSAWLRHLAAVVGGQRRSGGLGGDCGTDMDTDTDTAHVWAGRLGVRRLVQVQGGGVADVRVQPAAWRATYAGCGYVVRTDLPREAGRLGRETGWGALRGWCGGCETRTRRSGRGQALFERGGETGCRAWSSGVDVVNARHRQGAAGVRRRMSGHSRAAGSNRSTVVQPQATASTSSGTSAGT